MQIFFQVGRSNQADDVVDDMEEADEDEEDEEEEEEGAEKSDEDDEDRGADDGVAKGEKGSILPPVSDKATDE